MQNAKFTVSVRSSAIFEDGEFSFAGQYSTFLNVPLELIPLKYKKVVASLFTSRAIYYYKTKGFSEDEMVMAVGVLKMVDARAGGVMYTNDPNNPDRNVIIINAAWGLGKTVVDGTEEPDLYVVSKESRVILEKNIGKQKNIAVCTDEGGIKEGNIPEEIRGKPSLTDDEIITLFDSAVALENHYGKPQDIEWAVGRDDRVYILQTRPLRMLQVPRKVEGYNTLVDRGVIACKGIGCGKAFILKDEKDLKDFPEVFQKELCLLQGIPLRGS